MRRCADCRSRWPRRTISRMRPAPTIPSWSMAGCAICGIFELALVRESLKERRIWQRIAPHLVRPSAVSRAPLRAGFAARATLAAGLSLYDLLSFDRGWLDDPDQRLPGHSWFGKDAAVDARTFAGGAKIRRRVPLLRRADVCARAAGARMHASTRPTMAPPAPIISKRPKLLIRDGKAEGATVSDAVERHDVRRARRN